jgi:2-polyprenyl-6-methoxyphenol hydroxylase-like FAD-dependent oxidoreductase
VAVQQCPVKCQQPPPCLPGRRVELCRSSGRRLRSFSLGQCDGGPHEFRGVLRSNLLRVLADRLAPGTLLLGCPIERVEASPQGGILQLAGSGQRMGCLAVVGADGSRSAAAAAVGRPLPRYVGQSAIR